MGRKISSNIKQLRIKERLIERITGGEFAFGARFPGINELSSCCHVSYVTVCKAVKQLEIEGYLRCQPGVGYFVCYTSSDMSAARKEVNLISSNGYYRSHRDVFNRGIALFEQNNWQVNFLLHSSDLYELKPAINSPETFSIITAFNVNWERFAATFGHITRRVVVLGRLSGNPEIASVVADECASIKLCMEHLAQMGRKRVALTALMPGSELESIRIAAWRSIILDHGLSFNWMRRHLFALNEDVTPLTGREKKNLFLKYIQENIHDMDAVILPSCSRSLMEAIVESGIDIPRDLTVITIGCDAEFQKRYPQVLCMDNNLDGHFRYALNILEDRLAAGNTMDGSWFFCPPSKIIVAQDDPNPNKKEMLP